jgi:hypothetical protein
MRGLARPSIGSSGNPREKREKRGRRREERSRISACTRAPARVAPAPIHCARPESVIASQNSASGSGRVLLALLAGAGLRIARRSRSAGSTHDAGKPRREALLLRPDAKHHNLHGKEVLDYRSGHLGVLLVGRRISSQGTLCGPHGKTQFRVQPLGLIGDSRCLLSKQKPPSYGGFRSG